MFIVWGAWSIKRENYMTSNKDLGNYIQMKCNFQDSQPIDLKPHDPKMFYHIHQTWNWPQKKTSQLVKVLHCIVSLVHEKKDWKTETERWKQTW